MTILAGIETSAANFAATGSIYNSAGGEWFAPYTVLEDGDIDTLEANIFDMWTSSAFKLVLRNSTGGLLGATGSLAGTGVKQGAIIPVPVTAGQTVYLGIIPNTGYIKPRQNATTYAIRKDAASTFASPAADVDEGSATQSVPLIAINAQGTVTSSGPTVDSITDPIIGTGAVTIVTSEAAPTVDTITFTVGSVTQSQSYSTGDNTTHTIATPTRNLLPPIGTVTVDLKAGATVIATTTATLQQAAGYSVVTGSGVVDANCLPHTGFLDNGDIALSTDNITVSEDFTDATQTTRESGSIQFWDASEEIWGDVVIYPVNSEGSGVIGSIINSVIIQSIIS